MHIGRYAICVLKQLGKPVGPPTSSAANFSTAVKGASSGTLNLPQEHEQVSF